MIRALRCLLSAMVALFILSGFTYFYKYVPTRVVTPDGASDFCWKPFSNMNTMEEGISFLKVDSNGFMNSHPKSKTNDIDVLFMGSSHVQGVEVRANENMTYIMNELINETVYNIGVSSHSIYTCINNISNAIEQFHPKTAIVIELSTIPESIIDMQNIMDGKYPEIKSKTGRIINASQTIFPAIKRLVVSLQNWMNINRNKESTVVSDLVPDEEYRQFLQVFLTFIQRQIGSVKLVFFYHPTYYLDEKGDIVFNIPPQKTKIYAEECKKMGFSFVDLTDDFKKLYYEKHVLANGFINTAVGIGHLNKYGHEVIAERIAEIIIEGQ